MATALLIPLLLSRLCTAVQRLYFSVYSIAEEKAKMYISVDIYHLPVYLSGYRSIRLSSLSRLNLNTSFSVAGPNASNISCSIKHNTSNNWVGYISPCGGLKVSWHPFKLRTMSSLEQKRALRLTYTC